jgi:hypothetical protein
MNKGLIIPIMEKYEKLLIENIRNLYNNLNFTLPIELWQIGNEISDNATRQINELRLTHNITFKDVKDYTDDYSRWQGYQIKAFIVKYTEFDEIILCDCDVLFGINPEIIFNDKNYIETQSFLFKDFLYHYPNNLTEINNRISFIKELLPIKNEYFPNEWDYIYTNNYDPKKHSWFYVESGVVYMNKKIHGDVVNTLYELNYNWEETYKYVWGDKETFWLSFVKNNKPFYINPVAGFNYMKDSTKINCMENNNILCHTYNNIYFFSQKGYPKLK